MSPQNEILLIAIVVSIACTIPGTFLMLRSMAMMSDAISHTIVLGIVLAFFVVHSLNSPFLIVGAALVGLLTVFLVESITKTNLVAEDSAIGIIFPFLFSIAIILISRYASSVHLDTDAVLLGELSFAPFNRFIIFGVDIGPKSLYTMGIVLLINLSLLLVFFKEIKISTFDPSLAAVLGFSPLIIHYGLMAVVSITAVSAFETVGSILVVAFMVGPPITAYLLTSNLKKMILISFLIGGLNAFLGFELAIYFDVSISGSMATFTGITFMLVFFLSPQRGILSILVKRQLQKIEFAEKSLLFHLYNHEGNKNEEIENSRTKIYDHLYWNPIFLNILLKRLIKKKYIEIDTDIIKLTVDGRFFTVKSYEDIVAKM